MTRSALPPPLPQTRPTFFLCHRGTKRATVRRLQVQFREHGCDTWREVKAMGPDLANRAIFALLAEETGRVGLTEAVIWVNVNRLSSPIFNDIKKPPRLRRAASDVRFMRLDCENGLRLNEFQAAKREGYVLDPGGDPGWLTEYSVQGTKP